MWKVFPRARPSTSANGVVADFLRHVRADIYIVVVTGCPLLSGSSIGVLPAPGTPWGTPRPVVTRTSSSDFSRLEQWQSRVEGARPIVLDAAAPEGTPYTDVCSAPSGM